MVSRGGMLSAAVHLLVVVGVIGSGRGPAAVTGYIPGPVVDLPLPATGAEPGSSGGSRAPSAPAIPFGPVGVAPVPVVPVVPGGPTSIVDPRGLVPACDSLCARSWIPASGLQVMAVSELDAPPQLLSLREPRYPEALRQAGIRGSVTVRFVVDAAGRVESGSVQVESATDPAFSASAAESVLGERFTPGRSHGVAIRCQVRQLIRFDVY